MSTSVINCKVAELRKRGYNSFQEWQDKSELHVYCGRNMSFYVPGTNKSIFHNPFSVKTYDDKVFAMFLDYLIQSPKLLEEIKPKLKGRVLGCWCVPQRCHAHILASIADSDKTEIETIKQLKKMYGVEENNEYNEKEKKAIKQAIKNM